MSAPGLILPILRRPDFEFSSAGMILCLLYFTRFQCLTTSSLCHSAIADAAASPQCFAAADEFEIVVGHFRQGDDCLERLRRRAEALMSDAAPRRLYAIHFGAAGFRLTPRFCR